MDKKLQQYIDGIIGIPYELNGRSKNGMDCFGAVIMFYKEFLGIDLEDGIGELRPRWFDSKEYEDYKKELIMGRGSLIPRPDFYDLVLIGRAEIINHIGIYLGEDKVLNTTEKAGMCLSSLKALQRADMVKGFLKINGR